MNKIKLTILAIFILLFTSATVISQTDTSNKKFGDRVQKIILEKLKQKLDIDDKTAESVLDITRKNRKEIAELNKRRMSIMYYIENNLEANDLESKIDDIIEIESKIDSLKRNYIKELKIILTPQQVAKTLIFQKNIKKFFQKEMKERKRKKRF